MKAKYLILVSLMLAILTIGAVSASDAISEDLASDASDDVISEDVTADEIAVSQDTEDSAIETAENADVVEASDNTEAVLEASESNEVLSGHGTYMGYDYYAYIRTNYYDIDPNAPSAGSYDVAEIEDELFVDGVVNFYVDGVQVYSKSYNIMDNKNYVYVSNKDLVLPSSLTAGMHTVSVIYYKNGGAPITATALVKFWPALYYVPSMSIGETNYIRVYAGPGASGSANLYLYDNFIDVYNAAGSAAIVNGWAVFPVYGAYKTTLDYKVGCTINGQLFTDYATIYVKPNSPGYSASVTSKIYVGSTATVSFRGAATNGEISIYVDGKLAKKSTYFGGSYIDAVGGLGVGVHQVTVQYSRGDVFFSKTFNVNVVKKPNKISLKLKKVKVKKSAKKLVLKATLKINGKKAKGKKVTFKFNGKKFKAKTNKKGVAKVTIKKKFLKKLKVGKKVKYSVKYGKKTVKMSVKVKK